MFQFNFELEDAVDEDDDVIGIPSNAGAGGGGGVEDPEEEGAEAKEHACFEISLQELLETLPPVISYSPLSIPLASSTSSITLARRDLYDARFQLLSGESGATDEADDAEGAQSSLEAPDAERDTLRFLDAPSDLVRGVYEGGLKTWECSLDLAGYLHSRLSEIVPDGSERRILEIGCGTAIPSALMMFSLCSKATSRPHAAKTQIHVQDYNRDVLSLVALPNLLLAWYMSPLGAPHRTDDAPPPDPSEPGELLLPRALRAAFTQSLADAGITLRFFAGGWSSFPVDAPYTLVLSSETIYETRSLPALIRLLRLAAGATPAREDGDAVSNRLSAATNRLRVSPRTRTLVAAKVLYFGVGGGVSDFADTVEREHGRVDKVWENESGVGRQIMDVEW